MAQRHAWMPAGEEMKRLAYLLLFAAGAVGAANKSVALPEKEAFDKARKAVSYLLKDGDSAKFRNLEVPQGKWPRVCGEVNAKNGMGGYGGFQRFISSGHSDTTIMEESSPNFSGSWKTLCKKPDKDVEPG